MVEEQKALKDWTLGEVKEYCNEADCGLCPFYLRDEHLCRVSGGQIDDPRGWALCEKPREKDNPNANQHNSNEENALANAKPRICEVLGVEVDEIFTVDGYGDYKIDRNGQMWYWGKDSQIKTCDVLCRLIDDPTKAVHKPRFTEAEVEDAQALKKFFPDILGFQRDEERFLKVRRRELEDFYVPKKLFPNIQPGESVGISDILGVGA